MTCCSMFAQWTAGGFARILIQADPDLAGDKIAGAENKPYDPNRILKLEDNLKRYEDHFSRHLRILMDRFVVPPSL